MKNDFVYWDDMWNEPSVPEKTCCGKWDEIGNCTCQDAIMD